MTLGAPAWLFAWRIELIISPVCRVLSNGSNFMPTETCHYRYEIRELSQRVTCAKQSDHNLKHQEPYERINKVAEQKALFLTTKTDRLRIRTDTYGL
jgi:hypothetical protein